MNEEIQSILNHSVEYAKDLLIETKEFYPFGAFTDRVKQVHPLEFEVDKKNIPNNGKIIDSLEKYCSNELKENNITAYGLSYEVQIQLDESSAPTDAIAIDIHHATEKDVPLFYLPFNVSGEEVTFDSMFAVKR